MPSQVATAYVQIIPSAQGIGGGIAQALGGDAAADSAGRSFGGKLVGAIKGVIAAAGIGAALSKAITEGAALEQSIGGVETLFGDAANQVIAAADNAFATAGLSANAYMETVTGFSARLLQGLGGDTQAAAALADTAVTDMADNANKMGTSMETITQTYQSLARGNYEMLDNLKLGYGGTQAEMARLINDSGVLGDTMVATAENVNSIGFDKMIEAIHVVQTEMGITGTTALEAETTITGSLNALQASFSNVLANLALGRDLGPSLNALATTLTTFLTGNLLPALWNILSALPGALVTFLTSLGPQLAAGLQGLVSQITTGMTTSLPQMMQGGATMVQGIVQGITATLPSLLQSGAQMVVSAIQGFSQQYPALLDSGVQAVQSIVSGIVQMLPSVLQSAVEVVSAFLGMIVQNLPEVLSAGADILQSVVEGIGQSLPYIWQAAVELLQNFLTTIVQNLPEIIAAGFDLIVSLIEGIGNAMPNLITSAGEIYRTIWDTITSINWPQLGMDIVRGLINGLGAMGGALWDAATNIARSAFNAIKGFFDIGSPSRLMEFKIGPYIPQGLAIGIEKNAGYVTDAMDDLGLQSTSRLRSTIAAGTPRAGSGTAGRDGDILDAIFAAARLIVEAVRESGGDLYIGDDVIGRAYDRYRTDMAIVRGGV